MKRVSRRAAIMRGLAAVAAGSWATAPASAQAFPGKPLKFIVPFAPGGSTDLLARLVAKPLSERLGQPVVVENRTGAGGNIGADAVAKAAPDGHTLVMGSIGTHATNGLIYSSMPYDAVRDFAPVALVAAVTLVRGAPLRPCEERARVRGPAQEPPQRVQLRLRRRRRISAPRCRTVQARHGNGDAQHVPYKGSAGALSDLLAGRVPIMFADLPLVLPHIQAGNLRALAVADPESTPALPGVVSVAQSVPGYEASAWYGLFAPAKTPEPVLQRLRSEVVDIVKLPEMRKAMLELGAKPSGISGRPAQVPAGRDPTVARSRAQREHPDGLSLGPGSGSTSASGRCCVKTPGARRLR